MEADTLLQKMKEHRAALILFNCGPASDGQAFADGNEVIAQHILRIRDLESCIMRQGMALKYAGQPNPYPQSYNPENTVVEPTADGLTL